MELKLVALLRSGKSNSGCFIPHEAVFLRKEKHLRCLCVRSIFFSSSFFPPPFDLKCSTVTAAYFQETCQSHSTGGLSANEVEIREMEVISTDAKQRGNIIKAFKFSVAHTFAFNSHQTLDTIVFQKMLSVRNRKMDGLFNVFRCFFLTALLSSDCSCQLSYFFSSFSQQLEFFWYQHQKYSPMRLHPCTNWYQLTLWAHSQFVLIALKVSAGSYAILPCSVLFWVGRWKL